MWSAVRSSFVTYALDLLFLTLCSQCSLSFPRVYAVRVERPQNVLAVVRAHLHRRRLGCRCASPLGLRKSARPLSLSPVFLISPAADTGRTVVVCAEGGRNAAAYVTHPPLRGTPPGLPSAAGRGGGRSPLQALLLLPSSTSFSFSLNFRVASPSARCTDNLRRRKCAPPSRPCFSSNPPWHAVAAISCPPAFVGRETRRRNLRRPLESRRLCKARIVLSAGCTSLFVLLHRATDTTAR